MSLPGWTEQDLDRRHDRERFSCGEEALDTYFRRFARQNHQRAAAHCVVAERNDDLTGVLGFYTLGPASIAYFQAPIEITKGLGRYDVPCFRLGRLAVDQSVQGQGLGALLVLRAGQRCAAAARKVGGVGLLIHAKSDRVARWYQEFHALPLVDQPNALVIPLSFFEPGADLISRQ